MKKKPFLIELLLKVSLLILLLFLQATLFAGNNENPEFEQQKKVTINVKEESLFKILQSIIEQSGSEILFFENQVENIKCKNIVLNSVNVDIALNKVLENTNLSFKIQNGRYVIQSRGTQPGSPQTKVVNVSGIIRDSKGSVLPFVNIIVKGTKIGVTSNEDGRYLIKIPSTGATLVFSFIGMEKKEIIINETGKTDIKFDVILKESANEISELVFVSTGYQKMNKRDMVGALSTFSASDVLMPNQVSIDKMLQGIVPGMVVTNKSSRVGTSPSIKIRGTSTLLGDTEPLWVVDGIIQEDPISIPAASMLSEDMKNIIGNQISWLNPNDIETITVLKDASATAIYGSKASNGVIVVTTKLSTESRERISVNYTVSLTVNSKPNYGMFNLMNSQERVRFSDEAFASGVPYSSVPFLDKNSYDGVKRMFIEGYIGVDEQNSRRAYLETVNTDWLKLLTRNAITNTHNLSINGGSGKMSFTSSVGYSKQQGQEIGNNSERLSARIATIFNLSEKFKVNVSLIGSYSINEGFSAGVSPLSYATNTSRAIPAYNEDGTLAYYQKYNTYAYNRIIPSLSYNIINERDNSSSVTENMRMSANADLTWNIFKRLSYNFTGGYNLSNNFMSSYMSEKTYYVAGNYRGFDFGTEVPESASYKAAILPMGGEYFSNDAKQTSYNIQNKLTYFKAFENSRLNIFLGHELRSVSAVSTSNTVWGYSKERGEIIIMPTLPSELVPTSGASSTYTGYGVLGNLYNNRWKKIDKTDNFMSLFGTVAYSLKEKYVFNASIRNDWSNRFGQNINKRLDPVFSLGVSWKVANEKYIKNHFSWISQLNLRASFGLQGNALTNQSPELLLYKQGKLPIFNQYYSTINKIPNPNLKWERTTSWNFGADISLFERVNLVVDGYRRRSNAVIAQDIPQEFGIQSSIVNGGILYNSGVEATLSFALISRKETALSVSINSSKNWNSTGNPLKTPTLQNYLNGSSNVILKKGVPLSSIWSYSFAGLNSTNGSPIYNLLDTDRETALKDASSYLVLSGETVPPFSGGIGISFRYKAFTLGSTFSLLLGAKTRLPNPYSNFSNGTKLPSSEYNISKLLNNRWKTPGDESFTNIPSLNPYNTSSITLPDGINSSYPIEMWSLSDSQIVDASFLRLRGIDLTWRLNQKYLRKSKIRSLSITASGSNIFVIASKRFAGMDPELGNSVMPRSYSLGLSIGL